MIKHVLAAFGAVLCLATAQPVNADTVEMPAERVFPSSFGEVIFHHQMHAKDLAIKCNECHHAINAKKLNMPYADDLKAHSANCEICHSESERTRQKAFTCSVCHQTNPKNIADETLSSKVVLHKQCWKCHPVGTGKDASTACEKCHARKKQY